MFKAFVGKLTCGVALLVGFVACSAGSEDVYDDLAAPSAVDEAEASSEEGSAAPQNAAADVADVADVSSGSADVSVDSAVEPSDGDDTSAAVDPSGLVFVDCYASLVTCFPDRDLIFQQTGVVCVCQPPDLDQFCGTSLVDLECNL